MFKNRYLLVVGLFSILVVSLAISSFRTTSSPENGNAANDFSLRNPYWTWAFAPSTVRIMASDYYKRHPELSGRPVNSPGEASSPSPIDECFDVSLSEVAACRAASQLASP